MTTTHELTVTRHGGGEVLEVVERDLPSPPPGFVHVRVRAAGVNFIDVYQREGIYPIPTPFVLGSEGAGEVIAVGAGVDAAVGDVVAWGTVRGTTATLANLPADQVVPVPDGLDPRVAAAAMLQGMTAHYLVNSTYAVQPGDVALVHAAAGGVGQLLVQLIVAKGGTVIATAGGPAKLAIAERLGASTLIDYSQADDLVAQVRAATGGRGVDVAYDGVGAATFDASLASLRPRGLLALFGAASGQVEPLDLQRLNAGGSLYVTRPTLGNYVATREDLVWRATDILTALRDGDLGLEIGGEWPMTEAAAAYAALEGRHTTGKLLLLP